MFKYWFSVFKKTCKRFVLGAWVVTHAIFAKNTVLRSKKQFQNLTALLRICPQFLKDNEQFFGWSHNFHNPLSQHTYKKSFYK